ncbi:hypothetical protein ABNG02_08495 [Halorubrum ejinorense]|uniref:Uncharacterized protein n=1 Tax=Halorubrum ejinorense TaxID=425309 RepID=A0ABV4ILE0_9EURY
MSDRHPAPVASRRSRSARTERPDAVGSVDVDDSRLRADRSGSGQR